MGSSNSTKVRTDQFEKMLAAFNAKLRKKPARGRVQGGGRCIDGRDRRDRALDDAAGRLSTSGYLVGADGEARLLALAPLHDAALIGEFRGEVTADEYAALAATGDHVPIDPTHTDSPEIGAVGALAAQIADRVPNESAGRCTVRAASHRTDRGRRPPAGTRRRRAGRTGLSVPAGPAPLSRAVRRAGQRGRCRASAVAGHRVHDERDANRLGGVRQVAVVPPGVLGAIALELPIPAGAAYAEVLLAGFWYPTDVDETTTPPERFTARAVADLAD